MDKDDIIEITKLETFISNTIHNLKGNLYTRKITINNIHEILAEVIEIVEQIQKSGEQKREIVIKIIRQLVKDLVENSEEKNLLIEIIDKKILDNMIDVVVLATKGKININKKNYKQKIFSYFLLVLNFLINKMKKFK